MSERQRDRPAGPGKRPADDTANHPAPQTGESRPATPPPPRAEKDRASTAAADPRQKRIRRLKELVRDSDYDVPSDEVAASIIRGALFGAPDQDEQG